MKPVGGLGGVFGILCLFDGWSDKGVAEVEVIGKWGELGVNTTLVLKGMVVSGIGRERVKDGFDQGSLTQVIF